VVLAVQYQVCLVKRVISLSTQCSTAKGMGLSFTEPCPKILWESSMQFWCRLFMVMNYSVHSIMYTYYTLRAMRIKVPKVFAIVTTSLQIIQMVFGLAITLTVLHYKQTGIGCNVGDEQNKFSLFIYLSYFMLFAR